MSEKHCAVELHDSRVQSIERSDAGVVLRIKVYLHVSDGRPAESPGTGWTQQALLTVGGGSVESEPQAGELWITDGSITVGDELFDNFVPVPFEHSGVVTLRLEGAEGRLLVSGQSIALTLQGEPRFVEEVR